MSKRSREEDTEERYPEKWATQVVISDMMCEFLEIPRYYECSLGHARNLAMHKLVRYFKDNNLQRLEDKRKLRQDAFLIRLFGKDYDDLTYFNYEMRLFHHYTPVSKEKSQRTD